MRLDMDVRRLPIDRFIDQPIDQPYDRRIIVTVQKICRRCNPLNQAIEVFMTIKLRFGR